MATWLDAYFKAGVSRVLIDGSALPPETGINFAAGATGADNPALGASDITISALIAPTGTGFVHVTGGAVDPAAVQYINLATQVTGVLSIASGGTGLSTIGTAGQLFFVNVGGALPDWASVTGDINSSASTIGQLNITGIATLAGGTTTWGDGVHAVVLSAATSATIKTTGNNDLTLDVASGTGAHLNLGKAAVVGTGTENISITLGGAINAGTIQIGLQGAMNTIVAGDGPSTYVYGAPLCLMSYGSLDIGANGVTAAQSNLTINGGNATTTIKSGGPNFGSNSPLNLSATGGLNGINGGNGSTTSITSGQGGTSTTGTGGAGGALTCDAAPGGACSSSGGTAGTGGQGNFIGGTGGAAVSGATNGNGGDVYLDGGAAGAGAGTAANAGAVHVGTASNGVTIGKVGTTTTINGTVVLAGGTSVEVTAVKATNYTMDSGSALDYIIQLGFDSPATLTLSATAAAGRRVVVKDTTSNGANVTIGRNGKNINGVAANLIGIPNLGVVRLYVDASGNYWTE